MMSAFANVHPIWPLRIGLGLMYAYSGTDLIRHPFDWQGFLPLWFGDAVLRLMPLQIYLAIQGAGELLLATVFLLPFVPLMVVRIAAIAAALEFAGILIFTGIDLITFRDIGLFGAALGLFFLTARPADARQS